MLTRKAVDSVRALEVRLHPRQAARAVRHGVRVRSRQQLLQLLLNQHHRVTVIPSQPPLTDRRLKRQLVQHLRLTSLVIKHPPNLARRLLPVNLLSLILRQRTQIR